MTNDDEEGFLTQQLLDARHALELFKQESSARKFKQNELEKRLADTEQALLDYVNANGLKQFEVGTHKITIGISEVVDCPDIDAIPSQFIREKIVKEPNKILIKELRPAGANWYSIKTNQKITITTK